MSREQDLLETTNAVTWAMAFRNQFPRAVPDEPTMVSWFANAIETGRNAGRALSPPRGGDAAEKELEALLERLSIQGGVCFRRWESDGRTHADSAEFEVSGATPLAALQALDAALAEQQPTGSSKEEGQE